MGVQTCMFRAIVHCIYLTFGIYTTSNPSYVYVGLASALSAAGG